MDITGKNSQNNHKKRQLQMEQLALDADVKRLIREKQNVEVDMKRSRSELARIQSTVEDYKAKIRKLEEKELFLKNQSDHVKKQLINLGY